MSSMSYNKHCSDEPVASSKRTLGTQEQREIMELALIDEAKKMCLLCKRAFPTVDVLRKHVDKSDLHKVENFVSLYLHMCFRRT